MTQSLISDVPDMPNSDLQELQHYVRCWQLVEDGPAFHTHSSCLQAVHYRGTPAMLKIAKTEEEQRGAQLMLWWNGVGANTNTNTNTNAGAAQVLAQEGRALLMERACGDQSLIAMVRSGRDDAASRILCQVAARLHAPRLQPVPPGLMTLERWFEPLLLAAPVHGGVFARAAEIAANLLAAPQEVGVLHGDIHHGNVLDAGAQGWVAIDPKGLLGERGFDFANIFCNPDSAIATAPGRLARQVTVVAAAAKLEHARLLAWIISWAGLSAIWHIEDGESPTAALTVAEIALSGLADSRF